MKTLDTLLDDWNNVAGNKKSEISFDKFCDLMQHLPKEDLKTLFELYDIDHNNKISFEEYVLTVVVLMDGSLDEKLTRAPRLGTKVILKFKSSYLQFF